MYNKDICNVQWSNILRKNTPSHWRTIPTDKIQNVIINQPHSNMLKLLFWKLHSRLTPFSNKNKNAFQ